MPPLLNLLLLFFSATPLCLHATLRLPSFFSDHMVLQREHAAPLWGWDEPASTITVSFAGQVHETVADSSGRWRVMLRPLEASWKSRTLTVTGSERREIRDVLVGEIWMCAGQSNMNLMLKAAHNGDIECAGAARRGLRLLKLPLVGTQTPQDDIACEWTLSSPETAATFSAVGFIFGRLIHEVLDVPVGLIHNAWGGSEAEAWIRRSTLENDPRFEAVMTDTVRFEASIESGKAAADYPAAIAQWHADAEKSRQEKRPLPAQPYDPQRWLTGNSRPGNIFNGMVHPLAGFALRGVIWYQGESNARRAHAYRDLFALLIQEWRREWNQGNFSFYWVQLPDHRWERAAAEESDWAELREAQTMALKLPNTGQAVTIDLGEGNDIHPRDKGEVAARLARWALALDYHVPVAFRTPEFARITFEGRKASVAIDCFGSSLRTMDTDDVRGFYICGSDRIWHPAKAKIIGKEEVKVWSEKVAAPVGVRYAWADNPVCNLAADNGLPVTPFRTDNFPLSTRRN